LFGFYFGCTSLNHLSFSALSLSSERKKAYLKFQKSINPEEIEASNLLLSGCKKCMPWFAFLAVHDGR
jgi:hypothetical protein